MAENVTVYNTDVRAVTAQNILRHFKAGKALPVIVCIGSDKVTGDCLGPLVGHLLTTKHNVKTFVYGTLEYPVNALNLRESHDFIRSAHPGRKILAVDAALGRSEDVGVIRVIRGGVLPGSAVNKALPKVGDIAVTAVVNGQSVCGNRQLTATRLALVFRLAEAIAGGISDACVIAGMAS